MVKKTIKLLIVACVLMLNMQLAMASSSEVWQAEEADLTSLKRIAVFEPLYTPNTDSDITGESIQAMVSEQGQKVRLDTVTKKVVERAIANITGTDLAAMQEADKKQADEIFFKELPKQADAYMKMTVIHNSRVVLFFDIYDAKTQKRVYGAQVVASRNMNDDMETYELMTKRFYRGLLSDIEAQQDKQKKAK